MSRHRSILRVVAEPLLLAVVLAFAVRSAVRLYSIPSGSMLPSLQIGDHIVVAPYHRSVPQRGDVIVFRAPNQPSELLVKRVVAVPGDLIDTAAGRVRIGRRTLAEPYLMRQAATGAITPQLIPPGSYFVMGDNREDSVDSRRWGVLPRDLVVGHVHFVLWSSADAGPERAANASTWSAGAGAGGGFRLERIFKCVE